MNDREWGVNDMHSTMAESLQEMGIKQNHKVIQGRRHFWRSHCPASCSKKGQYQSQTGLVMALSSQALDQCGDCTIPVQLVPLLHSAQDEHLFHINNLNVSIGQRKKMRRKRERRINTEWQVDTKWKPHSSLFWHCTHTIQAVGKPKILRGSVVSDNGWAPG